MMKSSERVQSPNFSLRFMSQERNCFMLSLPCQGPYPTSDSKCLRQGRRLDVKDLELVKTTFLVSNCAGASNARRGPRCSNDSFKELSSLASLTS